MELKNKVETIIKNIVASSGTETGYREPLVGFASTTDPIFIEIKKIVGLHQLHPKEIFFLKQKPLLLSFCHLKKSL